MDHDKVILIACLGALAIQTVLSGVVLLRLSSELLRLSSEVEMALKKSRDYFSRTFDLVTEFMRRQAALNGAATLDAKGDDNG